MYTNKQIWSVSYPILLSLLAQNVINVTDTAFLGHVSEVALGASAMGGLFYICIFTIAFGFSTGSQIVIARRNGEGRYSGVGISIILTAHSGKMKGFDEVTKFAKNTTEGLLLGNQGTTAIFPINSAKELPQFKDGLLFHNGAYVKVRVPKY